MMVCRTFAVLGASVLIALTLAPALAVMPPTGDESSDESSDESRREFALAYRFYKAGRVEQAIERLEAFVEKYSDDPLKEKAEAILRDLGVGDGIRVVLVDREVFRKRFEMPEPQVLKLAESTVDELAKFYRPFKPVYKERELEIRFYDSQARYRKETGSINSSGMTSITGRDLKASRVEVKIQWYPPIRGGQKDRQVRTRSVLLHEGGHFLNAAYFGGFLPRVFEEGIATYLQTRLNKEYYVTRRETDRQRFEGEARNGLNRIKDFKAFRELLAAERGFGRGDAMINRWYALCYAVVDCLVDLQVEGQSGKSINDLFAELSKRALQRREAVLAKEPPGDFLPAVSGEELLRELLREMYDTDLETFHRALLQHVLKNYKQR